MSAKNEQVMVLDRDALVRLWLTEQVAQRKMTQAEADGHWKGYRESWHKLANYFSVADDAKLVAKLVGELGLSGKCYYKSYGGKLHVVFKGNPRVRAILTGTKYGVQNAKVVNMGIGKAGVAKSVKGGTFVSVILLTIWNIADYVLRDEATLGQLLGGIAGDVTKAVIAGGIGYAAATTAIALGVTFAAGPLIVAVLVGVAAGWALDAIDDHFKITEKLQKMLDDGLTQLQKRIEEQKQSMIDRGVEMAGEVIGGVVDLAQDAAMNYAKRQLDKLSWRLLPRLF